MDLSEKVSVETRIVNNIQDVFGTILGLQSFIAVFIAFLLDKTLDKTFLQETLQNLYRLSHVNAEQKI